MITGVNLPSDLEAQARADEAPLLRQYWPTNTRWLGRPDEPPQRDMTWAFDPNRDATSQYLP